MPQELWLLFATFMLSLMGLSLRRTHLLSALLCLEGMMLSIFIGMGLWAMKMSPLFSMIPVAMLTMTACEAALGLSILIATSRSFGSKNLDTINLLRC